MFAFYAWHLLAHSENYHAACKRAGLDYLAEMHEIHMEHHLEKFPPSDFYGSASLFAEMYPHGKPTIWSLVFSKGALGHLVRDLPQTTPAKELDRATDDAPAGGRPPPPPPPPPHSPLAHEWPLLALLVLLLVGAKLVCGASWGTSACAFVLYLCMASIGNGLHMSFHVRNFHLERFAWYRELRTLHYIHHIGDMKSNFAMLNMGLDQFFHSLAMQDVDLRPKRHAPTSSGFFRALVEGKRDADLPHGITVAGVMRSAAHSGLVATALGFDVPLDLAASGAEKRANLAKGGRFVYPAVLLRIALTAGAFSLWFATEARALGGEHASASMTPVVAAFVGRRYRLEESAIDDPGHALFAGVREWLQEGDGARAALACTASALTSEGLTALLVVVSVLGPSFRPLLAVIFVFLLRLALRLLGAVRAVALAPGSAAGAWAALPGTPHLVVFHGPHLFVSARIALCTVASLELLALALHGYTVKRASVSLRASAVVLAVALLTFEVGVSLALQLSWTFDLVLTLVVARYGTIVATRLAPLVDAFMP